MRSLSCLVLFLSSVALSLNCFSEPSSSSVPNLISYSGTVKTVSGEGRTVGVTFSIYKQEDGGAPLWLETQNVAVDSSGHYNVSLGSTRTEGIPADLFSSQEERWLGVTVEGQPEQPRVLLISVPYAFKAHEAETLGGLPASAFVKSDAQQGSPGTAPDDATLGSTGGQTGKGVGIKDLGHGKQGYLPVWLNPVYLGDSGLFQNKSGNVGVGTTTPQYRLDVSGDAHVSGSYYGNGSKLTGVVPGPGSPYYVQNGTTQQVSSNFNISGIGTAGTFNATSTAANHVYFISGNPVFGIGNLADWNVFVGYNAGLKDKPGSGQFNVFAGYYAGWADTKGSHNVFVGQQSGENNVLGSFNTFVGDFSGFNNGINSQTANDNTFIGASAGYGTNAGGANTFIGRQAGVANLDGTYNTGIGWQAGYANQHGQYNTYLGTFAAGNMISGSYNVMIGQNVGSGNGGGDSNIYISNNGGPESHIIRIGAQGTGNGQQNATYIAGISGASVPSGIAVLVNSHGQLGTTLSSRRFKEQIHDMGESSSALLKLRPVTFLYKPQYDEGQRTLQYGLIAEEVAEVYPDLVAYEPDGKPYTVKYQYLTTMLLNEMQKQYRRAEAEKEIVVEQQKKIEELEQRLERLERMVSSPLAVVAQK